MNILVSQDVLLRACFKTQGIDEGREQRARIPCTEHLRVGTTLDGLHSSGRMRVSDTKTCNAERFVGTNLSRHDLSPPDFRLDLDCLASQR
ncbi:hypothetical protein [Caballeronia sp. NK8]|uniref:hypothetical protein n=1 Tax=Caballeronia sp. NK8 TaxID=140098 RepID=UPI001CECE5F5|nr:hypothetical protein [Caballeronia sp. NK8]